LFDAILPKDAKVILELGSWLGKSTRFLLGAAPGATVIAVDHWEGDQSIFLGAGEEIFSRMPSLYERFLSNCWDYRERLIPIRNTISMGVAQVVDEKIIPGIVYLDASHQYPDARDDLATIGKAFPEAIIAGDDYGGKWQGVKRAVDEHAKANGLDVCTVGHAWTLASPQSSEEVRIRLMLSGAERYKRLSEGHERETGTAL
jgi:hypothetical protein